MVNLKKKKKLNKKDKYFMMVATTSFNILLILRVNYELIPLIKKNETK